MRNFRSLTIWNNSRILVKKIYTFSQQLPDSEKFGLTSQLRRASISVATNIAEGAARKSDKEFIQFLYISLGSIAEIETLIIITHELKYVNPDNIGGIEDLFVENRKIIIGLIKYLKNKKK